MNRAGIILGGLILLHATFVVGKEIREVSEASTSIQQSYKVSKGDHLEITNKYGQVVLHTWDKDSVKVQIDIRAYGNSRGESEKTLDRVEIDMDKTGQYIVLETVFDRSSNYFMEFWNSLSDNSRAILSKSKIEVNYEVFMPAHMPLELDNKFGDVFLDDLYGPVNLSLSHGNLKAGSFNSYTYMNIGFSGVTLNAIRQGKLVFKGVNAEIQEAGTIDINSSGSEWRVFEAENMRLNSRSDRNIRVDKVREIGGTVLFSSLYLGAVNKSADLEMNFGDLKIEALNESFESVYLDLKSTDSDIHFKKGAMVDADIEVRMDKLHAPAEIVDFEKRVLDEKKNLVKLTGVFGKGKDKASKLRIISPGGEVYLTVEVK